MIEQIISNFEGFTASDVVLAILDILIVWYLFYQILMLIRGTKAMQILFGLLVFVVLYLISKPELLDLGTLNWILDKFIASFIVIIVIIFQEDIRRGLGEFGKTGSLSTSATEDRLGAPAIEEIVKAASILSERRIGALIAIEMDAALEQYMVEGIKIDASISKELLVSLFIPYKANPTHDGAVIIRSQRIDSAGCFLPLSANDHIDKALGTRHRAAIGLSESTDAVIVVVSEETGTISVAHCEKLTRKLTPDALRDYLHKMFVRTNSSRHSTGSSAIIRRYKAWKGNR
ncbi:MAG: diadenylate cyclase CdaA [Proteobacteria bacterium]|nr:diadenylate cyclase CdaA [Pseudomonadota bacterium]